MLNAVRVEGCSGYQDRLAGDQQVARRRRRKEGSMFEVIFEAYCGYILET